MKISLDSGVLLNGNHSSSPWLEQTTKRLKLVFYGPLCNYKLFSFAKSVGNTRTEVVTSIQGCLIRGICQRQRHGNEVYWFHPWNKKLWQHDPACVNSLNIPQAEHPFFVLKVCLDILKRDMLKKKAWK